LLAVAKPIAIILFGNEFEGSGVLMAALAFTLPMIGWSNVIRTQFVIPKGRDHIYIITVVTGAILNLIINAIFIPKLGAMGAVIGTLVAEGSIPIVQFILLHKEIAYKDLLKKSIPAFLSGLLMYLIVRTISNLKISQPYLLIVEIGAGILSYIAIVTIYFVFFEKDTINKVLRKQKATVGNRHS
jgi:O-antigen/teichoic acid export membrane protein